ncbi:U1 small nuclear ribonucleoprotein C-like, partial [Plectropomus leopardus]|uniref:U1 small nuclear ribonucleoprotein C-like n=1 Tax=Plectropomus leopardus TaxID=160734 RepID=UPI001C4B2912
MLEESFLSAQTAGQDTFHQGHMAVSSSQADKTTHELAALAAASLDGPMSMLPQLGDSEEKLRQRQRLRQLILRQQQQKSALRQEKGLQEAAPGPPSAAPRLWPQVDPSAAPPADPFGRPPPPYPGTVRPSRTAFPGGFPAEQQGSSAPSEPPLLRQSVPRELGVRGAALRFGVPPGAPAGLQDSFLRPSQGVAPGSGLSLVEGVQMRRPMPGEFTGIRPLPAAGAHPHMMPGQPALTMSFIKEE